MKQRRILVPLVILGVSMLLVGCTALSGLSTSGSFSSSEMNEKPGNDYWRASYSNFDGFKYRTVDCAGEAIEVEITTESGTIGLRVIAEDGTVYFDESDLPEGSLTIEGVEDDKVTIRVTAEQHRGSFDLSW